MIISHSKKFILMSPWKTASSTCHATLRSYNDSPYDRSFHFNIALNRVVHQHLTLAELFALPEGKHDYKIGAFVRNPYDRAYSGFIQVQRDFREQPKREYSPNWIGDLVRSQIAENMSRVITAGFNFDEWIQGLPEYSIYDVGRNSNMVLHPAHYWTHVGGERRVGFVGKVESFETDFRDFCDYVEIDVPLLTSTNISNEAHATNALGYKYVDRMARRSIDRINDLFEIDFEAFGYEQL
jgi:hypothetical protein